MEQVIYEIRKRFKDGETFSQSDIDTYLRLFREKGISVMVLEELLSFYSKKPTSVQKVQEEAFVLPAEAMRTSYDVISQDYKELQYKNVHICSRIEQMEEELKKKTTICRWLGIVLAFFVVIVLYLLVR